MSQASPRRRKSKPFNPAHDRMATDLLRNAKVAPVEVDDPYEEGGKIIVMRSTRDDPVADMHARGHLTDCEFATCRHWQNAYERSEIGGVRGIDPTLEAVDGGRVWEGLTDTQRKAILSVSNARNILGENGNYVITQVLGHKKTIEQLAFEWKGAKRDTAGCKYVRRRFHECLETLGILFGFVVTTRA